MEEIINSLKNADPFSSWWPFILAFLIGMIITIRTITGGQNCPTTHLIVDKIVIVTGGNGGIGFEICKELAARSGHIIIACRNLEKGKLAINLIKRQVKLSRGIKCKIEARQLDLRSFDSIRRFVREISNDFKRVDILINNAGITFQPYNKTCDGFETHLQVNFLSGFLLSHLLIPLLNKSENGRIINVSAHAYINGKLNLDDPLNFEKNAKALHPRDSFAHSKLAILLMTRHLVKELKGTSITINACTPGLVRGTNHLRSSPLMSALCVKVMTYPWMWLFMKNPRQGAQCAIFLATDPTLKSETGNYFNDCEKNDVSDIAKDEELAAKLYTATLNALKLKYFTEKS